MLSLTRWELASLQLHRTFPDSALAPDTPEDHVSVHRQWEPLCLVPTCSSLSGPFKHSCLCHLQRLPPPSLLGPSFQF